MAVALYCKYISRKTPRIKIFSSVQFPNQSQLFEFIQVIKRMPSITFSSPLSAIENGRPVSSDLPNLSDASTQRQIQSYLASGQAVDNANQVEQALRHMSLFRSRYDGGL